MPANILTDNIEFKGKALGIPPLREKINSLTGSLTEQDVINLAEEFYNEYRNRYKNERDKWDDIKHNHYDVHCKTQASRGDLRRFIHKYKIEL